jgi:hypothetical protein
MLKNPKKRSSRIRKISKKIRRKNETRRRKTRRRNRKKNRKLTSQKKGLHLKNSLESCRKRFRREKTRRKSCELHENLKLTGKRVMSKFLKE